MCSNWLSVNIFCGSRDCYEVLGLERKESDPRIIKKAYRKLALTLHPDKNQEVDTTEEFREVAKAAEVLGDAEQKELYDYYLDHPRVCV
jgi:DnaJ-class molecular chaperone